MSGTNSELMAVAFYNSGYSSWTSRKRALDSKISSCLLSTENMLNPFTHKRIDHITLKFEYKRFHKLSHILACFTPFQKD